MKAQLFALLALVGLCAATMVVFQQPINMEMEPYYSVGRRVSASEKHTVHIAIKMRDDAPQVCDSLLNEIADFESPKYGQHLTLDQVSALLSNKEATRQVELWLSMNGVEFTTSKGGDFITVTANIGKIERLLKAKYFYYHSTFDNKIIKRTDSYSLPKQVAKYVDFVSHTVNFAPHMARFVTSESPAASGTTTPQTIFQTYHIQNPVVQNPNSNQSLFEGLGQDFSPADLTTFQQQFGLTQTAVSSVIGPNDGTACTADPNSCGEANLDVQYIMAVAQNANTVYWSIDQNSNDPFMDWAVALGNTPNPALVHSMSYGSLALEDSSVDVQRFNTEMCKAGLRGLTIVISSGDDGVANFIARQNASACGFMPSFPSTSPYVVAVGATQGPESSQPEVACTSANGGVITTGGGFSYWFNRPSFQDAAVQGFMSASGSNLPPQSMYSSHGRGYPDVAVLGYNYAVVLGGQTYQESGTSASAPVFAGMITLVNDARMSAGKAPLGYITPSLYKLAVSNPSIFNDITSGENNCCAGQPGQQICCQYGFTAIQGWDPLTGFGSINFPNFLAAFSAL
jgi:tripeptidyl-peptidase I